MSSVEPFAAPETPRPSVRNGAFTSSSVSNERARLHRSQVRDTILGIVLAILFLGMEAAGIWGAIHTGGTTGCWIGGGVALFSLGITGITMVKFKVLPRAKLFDALLFLSGGPIVLAICMSKRVEIHDKQEREPGYRPLFNPFS
jgi:hypothetical protein